MMRLAAVVLSLLCALALADCSSSSRVDGIVPDWANSHSGAMQYASEPERANAHAANEVPPAPARQAAARPGEE
jgi:hypothetical protein